MEIAFMLIANLVVSLIFTTLPEPQPKPEWSSYASAQQLIDADRLETGSHVNPFGGK